MAIVISIKNTCLCLFVFSYRLYNTRCIILNKGSNGIIWFCECYGGARSRKYIIAEGKRSISWNCFENRHTSTNKYYYFVLVGAQFIRIVLILCQRQWNDWCVKLFFLNKGCFECIYLSIVYIIMPRYLVEYFKNTGIGTVLIIFLLNAFSLNYSWIWVELGLN